MNDEALIARLRAVADKRLLKKLAEKTGIGYSYLSKLAQGYKSMEKMGAVYRAALETGIAEIMPEAPAASSDGGEVSIGG